MGNPYAPPGSRPPREGPGSSKDRDAYRTPPPREPSPPRPPTEGSPGPRVQNAQQLDALRLCGRFVVLVLAGLVVLPLGLPWSVASLGFFVAAIVAGVVALRATTRAGLGGSTTVALVTGMLAAGALISVVLALVSQWGAVEEAQRCTERSLTVQARDACSATMTDSVQRVLQDP